MDTYRYADAAAPAGAPLLILLHGTGGDETDLVELGRSLLPEAHIVAPRGDVSEAGALRFFKRTGMGVYDMDDLTRATTKMAAFIGSRVEGLKPASVTALGFSNGANLLAAVLFAAPQLLDRAVLMHPLIPFEPPPQPGLLGKRVVITAGRRDPIAPAEATEALARYFAAQGAAVETAWHEGGHELRREEVAAVGAFLAA